MYLKLEDILKNKKIKDLKWEKIENKKDIYIKSPKNSILVNIK